MDDTSTAVLGRLARAVTTAHPGARPLAETDRAALAPLLITPNDLRARLEAHLDGEAGRVSDTGTPREAGLSDNAVMTLRLRLPAPEVR
ncbi:hypothetical protein ACFV9D_23040 [Streptomyces sp. NPDC059875]|uniref:hypothetical protein n=1 Tax=unclassified Streptomyces TaxID=2593676 RepID=UPI00365319A6